MQVLLAGPRGFCAGVSRAVEIVERVLEIYGPPVYVKHEIIHNHQVVADLRNRGAVFVESLDEVPPPGPLIFSAHGVPPSDRALADERGLKVIDHLPAGDQSSPRSDPLRRRGYHVLYIGHRGYPEPIGTLGEIEADQGTLIETLAEADTVRVPDPERVVVLTQTTLSVQDTQAILARLRERFPKLELPPTEDICYATTNRQAAVSELSNEADLVWSSDRRPAPTSNRLVETAGAGPNSLPGAEPEEIDPGWLEGVKTVALSSGASAPSTWQETIARRELGAQKVEERGDRGRGRLVPAAEGAVLRVIQ